MSETQLPTIALAALPNLLAVLVGIPIQKWRLTDLRVHVDARFDEMRNPWRREFRGRRKFSEAYLVSKRTMINVTWSLISTKAWGIPAGTKMTSPGLNTRETPPRMDSPRMSP
jgi:hypothetical protein